MDTDLKRQGEKAMEVGTNKENKNRWRNKQKHKERKKDREREKRR